MSQLNSIATALGSGASLVAPNQLKLFGIDIAKPDHEMFDAPWATYKGMGLSIDGGIAVLEITGPLAFKLSWSGTSYDGLTEVLRRIEKDPDIKGLLLNIHSPGGLVSGCFEFCDQLHELAQNMPVKAIISSMAASAAYAIASQANEIVIEETGLAGSIGVVVTHFDYSKRAEMSGVKATYIYAGDQKTSGFPLAALDDAAKAAIQTEVDDIYEVFLAKVERGRASMTTEQIKDTQAAVFIGAKAVEAGLADRVGSGRALLKEMQQDLQTGVTRPITMESNMAQENPETVVSNEKEIVAAVSTALGEDRKRMQSILGSDEASGREELAKHLAFESDMDAAAAIAVLSKSPKATTESSLESIMEHFDNGILPDGGEPAPKATTIDVGQIFALRRGVK